MVKRNLICATFFLLSSFSLNSQVPLPSQAMALEQQGKLPEAEQAWRLITQQNPQDAGAFASLGVVLSKQAKYDQASFAYSKAIALNPRLPGIQLNWGLAEFKQGKFQAAIGPLSAALTANPGNAQALTLLGLSYYGAKRFNEAAKYLDLAVIQDPANMELRNVLAQSCFQTKNYSCAFDQFRQIVLHNPDSAPAHVLLGEVLDAMGKTPEALAEFQAAAKVAPREPEVNFGVGFLQWKLRSYDAAGNAFQKELALNPNHAQSLAYLGDVEMHENNFEKAVPVLEKAVQQENDIRMAYADLGAIFTQQKRYPEALSALQHAIKLAPSQPDAHFKLGRLYQAMGDDAAAESEFAKVRQLHEKANEDVASIMSKLSTHSPK
jgi:tetratricopeptide (TPR) repeat protein